MQTYQDQTVSKSCNSSKEHELVQYETQWIARLVCHKLYFAILLGTTYTITCEERFEYYRAN